MNVTTKFDVDTEVWFMEYNRPQCAKVQSINIWTSNSDTHEIKYRVVIVDPSKGKSVNLDKAEDDLFESKDALLDSFREETPKVSGTFRGEWKPKLIYMLNDIVKHDNSYWKCTQFSAICEPGGNEIWHKLPASDIQAL